MRAYSELPPDYVERGEFNLENSRLLMAMNLIGLVLLVGAGWLFAVLFTRLRPHTGEFILIFRSETPWQVLSTLLTFLVLLVLMIVLHEGLHGLAFWLFTRSRPQFTFKGWYASASAPGWYFTLPAYAIIGLLPLFGISLLGLALAPLLPESWIVPTWALLTMNAAGAIGDVTIVGWLFTLPRNALVQDFHTRTVAYVPQSARFGAER